MFCLTVALSVLCLVSASSADEPYSDRIVNGRTASINEYPYQVSLLQQGSHFCGGSLISPKCVLTAAHCIIDYVEGKLPIDILSVRAGSSQWASGGVVKQAESVTMHQNYDPKSMVFDVAIVKPLGEIIQSAVMRFATLGFNAPPGSTVVVTGWGKLNETNGILPKTLQSVDLTLLSNPQCSSRQYGYGSQITDSMLCAVGDGKDSCQGDSGGPLALKETDLLIGVVSWGAGCAQRGYPGVYVQLLHPIVKAFIERRCGKCYK